MISNEEGIIEFKDAVKKAKAQSFTECIKSSIYFLYVISPIAYFWNYDAYKSAWYLVQHQELLDI